MIRFKGKESTAKRLSIYLAFAFEQRCRQPYLRLTIRLFSPAYWHQTTYFYKFQWVFEGIELCRLAFMDSELDS
jgi:hypothetical protein